METINSYPSWEIQAKQMVQYLISFAGYSIYFLVPRWNHISALWYLWWKLLHTWTRDYWIKNYHWTSIQAVQSCGTKAMFCNNFHSRHVCLRDTEKYSIWIKVKAFNRKIYNLVAALPISTLQSRLAKAGAATLQRSMITVQQVLRNNTTEEQTGKWDNILNSF